MVSRNSDFSRLCCPRCGYDLTGVTSTWNTSCPLQCTCTECGFEIDLSELNAQGNVPNWFVAAAPDAWGWIGRLPGTMLRMTVPFWPWRTLGPFAFNSSFGARQTLAWSVAILVCLMMSAAMILVVPVEGWNIAHDIETRVVFRAEARKAIAKRDRILGEDAGPWTGTDPKVKSVLKSLDDPLAIPLGAARDSLERLWAMARFTDVPRGRLLRLLCHRSGKLHTRATTLISNSSDSVDPWKFVGGLPRFWILILLLPVAMVVMSGFGIRISHGFDRTRASGWVQLRLALLSCCILFPVLLFLGVRLAMSDVLATQAPWSRAHAEFRMVPVQAAGGGLLLLATWWWGAYRMLQIRFAMLTAYLMVILISIASMIIIPGLFMLYWYLTGDKVIT